MARKTFHHLAVGDEVAVEHYRWTGGADEEIVSSQTGTVVTVFKRRLDIRFIEDLWEGSAEGGTWMHGQFSRQSGYRWGSGEDDYRISPKHAEKKA